LCFKLLIGFLFFARQKNKKKRAPRTRSQHALFKQANAIGSVHVAFHTVRGQPTLEGFHSKIIAKMIINRFNRLRLICVEFKENLCAQGIESSPRVPAGKMIY